MKCLPPTDLDPAARAQIRRVVQQFAGRRCDRDDLAQDLALHVVAQGDPTRPIPRGAIHVLLHAPHAEGRRPAAFGTGRQAGPAPRGAC